MEIALIKTIQSISNSFFDVFFLLCTRLGEEIFFFLVFSVIYWCFSKESALKLGLFYVISAGANFVMKSLVNRPRPYVADNTILNKKPAFGTSFPSGHSQNYALLASTASLDMHHNRIGSKRFRISIYIVFLIGAILVPISRMYLGQHYLTDTIAGLIIGFAVTLVCEMIYIYLKKKIDKTTTKFLLLGTIIVAVVAMIIAAILSISSVSVYKYLIIATCLIGGYLIEDTWIKYEPDKNVKMACFKASIGLIVFLAIYFSIKALVQGAWGTYLVCGVGALVSTVVLPLLFKNIFRKKEI